MVETVAHALSLKRYSGYALLRLSSNCLDMICTQAMRLSAATDWHADIALVRNTCRESRQNGMDAPRSIPGRVNLEEHKEVCSGVLCLCEGQVWVDLG